MWILYSKAGWRQPICILDFNWILWHLEVEFIDITFSSQVTVEVNNKDNIGDGNDEYRQSIKSRALRECRNKRYKQPNYTSFLSDDWFHLHDWNWKLDFKYNNLWSSRYSWSLSDLYSVTFTLLFTPLSSTDKVNYDYPLLISDGMLVYVKSVPWSIITDQFQKTIFCLSMLQQLWVNQYIHS